MKPGLIKRILTTTALTGLCLHAPMSVARTERPPKVSVESFAQHTGDRITYHYRISNQTPLNITSIAIGRDSLNDADPANDIYELLERPSGWNLKFGIPSASYNAPTGWRLNMLPPEEDVVLGAIVWVPLNDRSPKFMAGQTLSKFSVTLDGSDPNYLSGHALIGFEEEPPSSMNVMIRPIDATPPILTVKLSPNTLFVQEGKPVAINATFDVQDDYDSMPSIRLESISAEDGVMTDEILDASPGLDDRYFKIRVDDEQSRSRTYVVTYSATDASGNQTITSASVTVAPREN